MENESAKSTMESPSMMTYVIGAVLVLAVVAGAWYFRSKTPYTMSGSGDQGAIVAQASPTPGPITALSCDNQYFNPKIGFNEYYLSAEGGDVNAATSVTCDFRVTVNDAVVASSTATSPLTGAPERSGQTYRCTTDAVALTPGVVSTVSVDVTDDLGVTETCSAEFTFPTP